jgi:hypothetical protein
MTKNKNDTPVLNQDLSIGNTPNGNKESGQDSSLTSVLGLSPAIAPPIFVDAIQLPVNLYGPSVPKGLNGQWLKIPLTESLKDAFQTPAISLSPEGRFAVEKKVFTANGASSYRYQYGMPTPSNSKSLKNQFTDAELLTVTQTPFTQSLAELQVNCFLCSWIDLVEYLKHSTSKFHSSNVFRSPVIKVLPQVLNRFEVCREYPIIGDHVELHSKLQKLLSSTYGAVGKDRTWSGPRQDNGDEIIYRIPLPLSLVGSKKVKGQEVQLKLYRKGERLRVEVVFLNFPVSGFPDNSKGITASYTRSAELIHEQAVKLLSEGEIILNQVHQHLFKDLKDLDVNLLWSKLKNELKFKGVRKDLCFLRMVEDLSTKGSYTPAQHKEHRLHGCRLKKLTDRIYGILEEIPTSAKKNQCKSYRLRDGWEKSSTFSGNSIKAPVHKFIDANDLSNELKSNLKSIGLDLDNLPSEGIILKPLKSLNEQGQ